MGDSIKLQLCMVEAMKTDAKPGTVVAFRIVHGSIQNYAQLLVLSQNNIPVTLTIEPAEDLLDVAPAIDYSDVDEAFDPDLPDDEDEDGIA